MNEQRLQGVIGVIEKDGKYLFGLESKDSPIKGKWRLLGGKLEAGESPRQALVRELREEAGIEVMIDGYVANFDGTHRDISIDVYYGRYVSGEMKPKLDENSRIGWFDFKEIIGMNIETLSDKAFCRYVALKFNEARVREKAEAVKETPSRRHDYGPYMGCDAGGIG
jgi:8-oxo-dGTP diphosphatase